MNNRKIITIGNSKVGASYRPYCIAEIGINHNGSVDIAKKMIDVAKDSGANAVKFQTFKANELCGDQDQMFAYTSNGKSISEPMIKMFERYELKDGDWKGLRDYCEHRGIDFLSTPQNLSDLKLLVDLGISAIKVGSDDFNNLPLLLEYAKTGLPLILSCGMSNLAEVYQALDVVGWFNGYPVVLLLCTSQYPTPECDVNINKLKTLQNAFPGLVVGFSDHTQGTVAASMGVALGASVFEKHFTLDHSLDGPDHWFSEDPDGIRDWVNVIQHASKMLGSEYVRPTKTESQNKKEFRRVLVASREIEFGEEFSSNNLVTRRIAGGSGFDPSMYFKLLGKKSWKKFNKFSPINFD